MGGWVGRLGAFIGLFLGIMFVPTFRLLYQVCLYFPLCWEKCAQMCKMTSKSLNWHP